FAPDGKTVASVGPDYRIQRWTADGKPLEVTEPPQGLLTAQVTGLAFADNERVIAWMTAAQFAVAWEAPTGNLLSPATEHVAGIRSIAFPDGAGVIPSGLGGRVVRWDRASGQRGETISLMAARLRGQPLIRRAVYLSADGTRGVWAHNNTTEVYDLAS